MEFRRGTIEDLDHICCLIESAIKRMEAQGIHQWDEVYPSREDFVHDIINGILYTVTENNRLIAIYVISTEYDPQYSNGKWECDGETACIIHRLCVAPEVQNRGIGRKLLSHIEDQLRNKGFESVRLDVFSENPFAIRLYEKSGYIRRGHADWRKGRFWLMEKKLQAISAGTSPISDIDHIICL